MTKEIIEEISTDLIDDPESAMRSELDRDALWELADNIKQNGLINPITVRPKGGKYEVVAGHRRLSACKIAGKVKVACVVRELTDQEVFEIMASENLERVDVDLLDESNFISEYLQKTQKSIPDVAKSLRRSVGYVESRLAIGLMPDYMKGYLKRGEMKLGVALALAQITDEKTRRVWCEMAARDGTSVAQAEYWLHGFKLNQLPGGTQSDEPPQGYEPAEIRPVMFECAIDGKRYDSRMCRSVIIYEGNMQLFQQVVQAVRETTSEEESAPPRPERGEGAGGEG